MVGVVRGGLGGHLLALGRHRRETEGLQVVVQEHDGLGVCGFHGVAPFIWRAGCNRSCAQSGEGLIGAEVGWVDGHGLEVGVAVEAEEPDRLFGVVEQDQRNGVGSRRPDGEGRLDRFGERGAAWRSPRAAAP